MGHPDGRQSVDIERARAVKELLDGEAANRGIEELDHVKGRELCSAATAQTIHELQKATGIGADDGLSSGGEQVRNFAVAKFVRWLRVEQVIDACRATTEIGFGNL